MDVFALNKKITEDYASFIGSFIRIRDERIREAVNHEVKNGLLWPAPLIQLNPAFEMAGTVDEFVKRGILHPECSRIFRRDKDKKPEGDPMNLFRHQAEAIEAAKSGDSYVLTTGTGSGKSLAYIIPIVDYVLREGSGKGIRAIIIYPMNALANSQYQELAKFLRCGYPQGKEPVSFEQYTGQENDEKREEIMANPPDILLTNYAMLELILTRPRERKKLVKAAHGLRFLVLDELHTYRGRQGSDVAMLVRRVREACKAENLQCIGTSATLAGPGTYDQQRAEVARVVSLLFGANVKPERVIGETLRRLTPALDLESQEFRQALRDRVMHLEERMPSSFEEFVSDPLSIWIESTFGLRPDTSSPDGRLVRAVPCRISGDNGAARRLASHIGLDPDRREDVELCEHAIMRGLMAGHDFKNPENGFPAFAFKLHQFFRSGDVVHATIEPQEIRYITVQGQKYVPGDRSRHLFPLVFCRECGQEFYSVSRVFDKEAGGERLVPRNFSNPILDEDEAQPGYVYINAKDPWPDNPDEVVDRLPDDWVEESGGVKRVLRDRAKLLPQNTRIAPDGTFSDDGTPATFIPAPFRFCPACGVAYEFLQKSDFGKLTTLGLEGRSSSVTVLSLSAIRGLREDPDPKMERKARKLLSFTDNRQDASLQAGHFNDFVEMGLLRAALYKALAAAGDKGLRHDEIALRVFEALSLPLSEYAIDPNVKYQAKINTERALQHVLGYRVYRDLKHGWRLNFPNLEQCGLLRIEYESLKELCEDEDVWKGRAEALVGASPEARRRISQALLDYIRRELAIKVDYLNPAFQERIRQQSNQYLADPWALGETEKLEYAATVFPRSKEPGDSGANVFLSARGGFGKYLRRHGTLPHLTRRLSEAETEEVIRDLLDALRIGGLVTVVQEAGGGKPVPGYQLSAACMVWKAGSGTEVYYDPIRIPRGSSEGRPNPFFVDYYTRTAFEVRGMKSHEHTAQVSYEHRREREEAFRTGELPVMYCSPTMELGVDISQLNVVNMRNVPPTPANYAQRSGRAGRSGQPALVFTYCSRMNSHDQYFFDRQEEMVAGSVTPPRLDLSNEDLIRSHVQAIWLAETGLDLGTSLVDILDLDTPTLELKPSVKAAIHDVSARTRAIAAARRVVDGIVKEIGKPDWYYDGWVEDVLARAPEVFDRACDRWRSIYIAARDLRESQHRIIGDASKNQAAKNRAKALRREAESQIELLTQSDNAVQSDFYSYRYFAGEGFLPGYNFPRLPISAFIPGRHVKSQKDEFVSRPRFLAISEFGPKSIIYHEGRRFSIDKVIMPISEEGIATQSAKLCERCGYLHPTAGGPGPDLCERCGEPLDGEFRDLFRMQNVSTRLMDRITCDEEERLRFGYELRTAVRFQEHGGRPICRVATLKSDGQNLATLTYGHGAVIWRINLGWRKRENMNQYGFVLDLEQGRWRSEKWMSELLEEESAETEGRAQRVIPYVEDTKNCLLFEPHVPLDAGQFASLEAALKKAIQVVFQLEDDELAVEPLPSRDERRLVMLYEASEGGAGVLRRLVDDPAAVREVARAALEICHFDPDTGDDRRRAEWAREDCEAACYSCLMSYANQLDHAILDRHGIRDVLLSIARAHVAASPAPATREDHLEDLLARCDSDLERRFLRFLHEGGYRLPTDAQVLVESCAARPDFLYRDEGAAVFVDGPHHEFADQSLRDADATERLEDAGYTVVRVRHDDDWEKVVAEFPSVFGRRP